MQYGRVFSRARGIRLGPESWWAKTTTAMAQAMVNTPPISSECHAMTALTAAIARAINRGIPRALLQESSVHCSVLE